MNKTQLITALRAHLADKEDIANEAAPALALMRHSLVELEKSTSGNQVDNGEATALRKELASADNTITQLRDIANDREGFLYSLLADLGMVPEVDDEPVDSLAEALGLVPGLLDDLQTKVANLYAAGDEEAGDKDRFIDGVRNLLDPIAPQGAQLLSLQEMWEVFETASTRYASLEKGIEERDQQIAEADKRLARVETLELIITRCAEAAGMSVTSVGDLPVYALEERIKLIAQQRDAATGSNGRDEEPAEGTLEAIIDQILTIVRLDWQDVETLPQEIQQLRDEANGNQHDMPLVSWVTDAIDLAHAVRGNLAPENRVMAKAADAIILGAPRGEDA